MSKEKKKRKKRGQKKRVENSSKKLFPLLCYLFLSKERKMSLRRDESTPSFSKAKDGGLTVVSAFGAPV